MKVLRALGAAVALASASLACSEPATPTSATSTSSSPFAVNLNGLYGGSTVLTNVIGGECVGADLGGRVGSVDLNTVTISQNQSDVTAILRSATTGLQCTYTGNARSATFAVNAKSCDASEILFRCNNGEARILELVGSTITATVTGNTTRGTIASSYNVFREDNEGTRIPVAGLTTQQSFDATRR